MESPSEYFCQLTDLSVLSYVPFSCLSQPHYKNSVMLCCNTSFHMAVLCAIFKTSVQSTKMLSSRGNSKSIKPSSYTCPLLLTFHCTFPFYYGDGKKIISLNCSKNLHLASAWEKIQQHPWKRQIRHFFWSTVTVQNILQSLSSFISYISQGF